MSSNGSSQDKSEKSLSTEEEIKLGLSSFRSSSPKEYSPKTWIPEGSKRESSLQCCKIQSEYTAPSTERGIVRRDEICLDLISCVGDEHQE